MKQLDVVQLKDGRNATIVEIFEDGKAFLVEISDSLGRAIECPFVEKEDIKKIIYVA